MKGLENMTYKKNLKNLMVYPKEEKSQGGAMKLFKYANSRCKEVRHKAFIGLTYFCFKCSKHQFSSLNKS